jgi:hypothetical protein
MNRVQHSIEIAREHLTGCTPEQIARTDETLALDFNEHFSYQEIQARAHVSGKLSTEEAQIIYAALGEVGSSANGGWSAGVDTATKYAVTLTIQALLKQRIAGRA